MVDGLCAIKNLQQPFARRRLDIERVPADIEGVVDSRQIYFTIGLNGNLETLLAEIAL
jgi:hypothetical protein